jgi:cytochrome c biogenesis protein CcdA
VISGVIVGLFGLHLLVPSLWERVSVGGGWYAKAQQWLAAAGGHKGHGGDLLLGAALGPIFTSCSPTYALIVATVLPASFAAGLLYLAAYAVGLAGTLLLVAVFGRAMTRKLGWFANPEGSLRKVIGVVFIVVGLMVITGLDKAFQTYVLEQGWYDPVAELEQRF